MWPLQKKMKEFVRIRVAAILVVGAFNFGLGVYLGYEMSYSFLGAVSLVVAAIPEMLPALVTSILALSGVVMAGRKALANFGIDPDEIDTLIVGTETGVDHSKPVAVYVHELLGLPGSAEDWRGRPAAQVRQILEQAASEVGLKIAVRRPTTPRKFRKEFHDLADDPGRGG